LIVKEILSPFHIFLLLRNLKLTTLLPSASSGKEPISFLSKFKN
jgi:hypothetical protein